MMIIRNFIFATLVLIIVFLIYLHFKPSAESNVDEALSLYLKGRYEASENLLKETEKELPEAQYHLYEAYIERARDHLEASDKQLLQSLTVAQKDKENTGILTEIYLNQALNAYLMNDPKAMALPLQKASQIFGEHNEKTNFLKALQSSLQDHYEQLEPFLAQSLPDFSISSWMEKSFKSIFTPSWKFIQQAKVDIAKGNYLQVRQNLEKEINKASGNTQNELYWLLGTSYVQEAQGKSPAAATPYYKLAFSYFNRIPAQNERYQNERKKMLSLFNKQLETDLKSHLYQELPFFLSAYESWGAHSEIESLRGQLLKAFNEQIVRPKGDGIVELSKVLNQLVSNPQEKQALLDKIKVQLSNALAMGNVDIIDKYYEAASSLSTNPDKLTEEISLIVGNETVNMVLLDDEQLDQTRTYVEFWQKIVKNPQQRLAFATLLVYVAENLWKSKEQRDKALTLIKLAVSFLNPAERATLQSVYSASLKQAYELSLSDNDISLLKSVVKAQQDLNISSLDEQEKKDGKEQLRQAQEFFDRKQYTSAEKKAAWVLELEPDNQSALDIMGTVNYLTSNYDKALLYLSKLKEPSKANQEALAISEIVAGDSNKGTELLAKMTQNDLSADLVLRIGFGLLEKNKPEQSVEWFKKLKQQTPESIAGLAYAEYKMGKWESVFHDYFQLPADFRNLNGMRSIVLWSLISLGQMDEAEILFQNILENASQPPQQAYSLPFQSFKSIFLDSQTPDFIAGQYYKNIKGDLNKALSYFLKIQPPTPFVWLEIGDTLLSMGDEHEAKAALQQALKESKGTNWESEIAKQALPLYARVEIQLGNTVDSVSAYTEFFHLFPKSLTYRSSYAEALMDMHRYRDALKQYELLEKNNLLLPHDLPNYLACLIHMNAFSEAQQIAKKWLQQTPPLPIDIQLDIADQMDILHSKRFVNDVLKKASKETHRSLSTNEALLNLWIQQGQYDKAADLVKKIRQNLEKTPQGLLLLTKLNERLSQPATALEFAQKALNLDPENLEAKKFIEEHVQAFGPIESRINTIQKDLDADPENISLKLNLANAYIDDAQAINLVHPDIPITQMPKLRQAYLILEKITKEHKDIPRAYYLLGKTLFLLEDYKAASETLQKALKLDRSYGNAAKYLGLTLVGLKNFSKAADTITEYLRYTPDDPDGWHELAKIYHDSDNPIDAIYALEQVLKYQPNNAEAYLDLASVNLEIKNFESAKISLEKALKIDPTNQAALKELLILVYNPLFERHKESKKERETLYQAYRALNPKEADKLIKQLKEIQNIQYKNDFENN